MSPATLGMLVPEDETDLLSFKYTWPYIGYIFVAFE